MSDASRPVGPLALLALGVNGIVGVGIFFAPADLAARVGAGSVAVVAATALALVPVALVFATLGSRFDVDGGPVVFARAAFGERAGFAVGWISYVSAIASTAAVIAGLTSATAPQAGLDGLAALRTVAIGLACVLALVVSTGLAISARAWTTLTVLKLLPLLLLAAAFGAMRGAPAPAAVPAADPGLHDWLSAGLLATFALQGFEIVPVLAGRARASARAVPAATLGSLVFAAALYVVLQSAAVATLPALPASGAPLADAAGVLGGPLFSAVVAAGTSVSALGISLGMMVTTPHYLAALARGAGLGLGLEDVDERGVPRRALATTWVLVLVLLVAGDRGQLFALSSTAVLTQYVVTAAALAALVRRGERGLRPWHAWPALPTAVVGIALVGGATRREAVMAVLALALGFVLRAAARSRAGGAPNGPAPAGGGA